MTDFAPPEDASPPDPVARPAASRWALWRLLKRFLGPIFAVAAFGAVLSGLLGYWRAYDTVVVAKSAPAVVTADASPLSIVVLPFQNPTGDPSAFKTLLSLLPKSPSSYGNLGLVYFYGGEPKKAIELLAQAINLDPKHPDDFYLFNMGRAYFMLGDNDAAIEWCLKSIERDPTYAEKYSYLAMAYALKGDEDKARAAAAAQRRLDPGYRLLNDERPEPSQPNAYKDWYENKLVPASRKAGLPE